MDRRLNKFIILSFVLGVSLAALPVQAATLYLRPSQTQVSAGNIVNVEVLVNTDNKYINNAESIIQYPTDLLEIVSVDKSSIFTLWVQEPNYSNNIGQLSFNGGVPNPGYKGPTGRIASIVFRAKKTGTASVVFSDSAVRENDGLGTNILTAKNGAEISISQPAAPVPVAPPAPVTAPAPAPVKVKADTDKPKGLSVETEKLENGQVALKLKATDSSSGIDYFQIDPDTELPFTVKADKSGEATAKVRFSSGGAHAIWVRVYDESGNMAETKVSVSLDDFKTAGLRIDSYPAKIRVNEGVEVTGSAPYEDAIVRVSLKNNKGVVSVYKVKSNSSLKFYISSQPITEEGDLTLWADVIETDGTVLATSDKLKIEVEKPLLLTLGSYTIGLMKVLIPAVGLVVSFLLIILYGWLKFFTLYRQIKKEGLEVEKIVDKSFELLKKDLENHLMKLNKAKAKRKLTAEERSFLRSFGKNLEEAEQIIRKEVKDISK